MEHPTVRAPQRLSVAPCRHLRGLLFRLRTLSTAFALTLFLHSQAIADRSDTIVIFNKKSKESNAIARHYALKRNVPTALILGLDLPTTEIISRRDYFEQLELPTQTFLEKQHLLELKAPSLSSPPPTPQTALIPGSAVIQSTIRYVVLCFGVPSHITEATGLVEPNTEKLRPEIRRNEASVDTELATLPDRPHQLPLTGPLRNPVYGVTNAALITPQRGVLIVARLDAPNASIVTNMINNALRAEEFGLAGRAYFDTRGIKEGSYRLGDDWMRSAARSAIDTGWETYIDDKPETFPSGLIMSQIALYGGWYSGSVVGPFTQPQLEFVPGAIAYHLHSFSAATIRSTSQNWVGPLLAKGATATLGCVSEPYLEATPDVSVLFSRLLMGGFSFGEAAYASLPALSWQVTIVGDPLYHPVPRRYQALHAEMEAASSKQIEWSFLRLVNQNLRTGMPIATLIQTMEKTKEVASSAVLQEKLGELYMRHGRVFDAIRAQETALTLSPSPQQKARLLLALAPRLALYEREDDALKAYLTLAQEYPDYSDLKPWLEKALELAKRLGKTNEARLLEDQLGGPRKR